MESAKEAIDLTTIQCGKKQYLPKAFIRLQELKACVTTVTRFEAAKTVSIYI
jgi:hypothetical protein